MNLLKELNQKIEYDNNEISILELFIKDSKYFYNSVHLFKIHRVTKLFLISHEADLVFASYNSLDITDKKEKINNIIDKFNISYNMLISIGFSFQVILSYTYFEFYDLSSIIDEIHHKKYFWRRIITKKEKKLLVDSNEQIIYFIKEKNTYTFRHNLVTINIPIYLFQYVDEYIEKSHRISHKRIIISGTLYNKDKNQYIQQQQKYDEWKSVREEQIKFTKEVREKQESKIQINKAIPENIFVNNKEVSQNLEKPKHKLNCNDFIIRCTIFKCAFKQHKIVDIDASIDIINISTNNTISMIIPAGYCSNCNKYFIMDTTYLKIFSKGLPLCKIIDERTYKISSMSTPNKWGAQESILKQYGYNVSAIENLTDTKRQKILAIIIDINALTKVEIMGYLKYFIRIHQSDSRFEKAISKWNNDIDFVSEYNKGYYTTYKVSGLKKNW